MFTLRKVNESLLINNEEQTKTRMGVDNVVSILGEQLELQKRDMLQRREDEIEAKRSRRAVLAGGAGGAVASGGLFREEIAEGPGLLGSLKRGALAVAGTATAALGYRQYARSRTRAAETRRLQLAQEAEARARAGQVETERFQRTQQNIDTSQRLQADEDLRARRAQQASIEGDLAEAERTRAQRAEAARRTRLINEYYRGSDSPEARQLAAEQRIRITNEQRTARTLRALEAAKTTGLDRVNAGIETPTPRVQTTTPELTTPTADTTPPRVPTADAPARVPTPTVSRMVAPNADEIFRALGAAQAPTRGPLVDMIDAPESRMQLQQLESDLGVKYHVTEDGRVIARRTNGQILAAADFDNAIDSLRNVQARPSGTARVGRVAVGGLVAADLAVSGLYGASEAIEEGRTTRGDITAGTAAGIATAPADFFAFGANTLASGLEYMFPNYFADKPSERLDFSALRQDISRSGGSALSNVPLLDEQASETTVNSIVKANEAVENTFQKIGENISSAFDPNRSPTSPYAALTQEDYLKIADGTYGSQPTVVNNYYNQPAAAPAGNGNGGGVYLLPAAPTVDVFDN